MSGISEIQEAILALAESEYLQLRQWFSELDWEKWDKEIEEDSQAGRLDFLAKGALKAKEDGALQEL